jgi:hypothetical protein
MEGSPSHCWRLEIESGGYSRPTLIKNTHLRSIDWSLRRRVAATLQDGAQRRTGKSHIFIERAHANVYRAARRGSGWRRGRRDNSDNFFGG